MRLAWTVLTHPNKSKCRAGIIPKVSKQRAARLPPTPAFPSRHPLSPCLLWQMDGNLIIYQANDVSKSTTRARIGPGSMRQGKTARLSDGRIPSIFGTGGEGKQKNHATRIAEAPGMLVR